MYRTIRNLSSLFLFAVCLWLTVSLLLPIGLPFLLGLALAVAAEPLVGRLARKMPRGLAAGLGVTGALGFLVILVVLACALVIRELGMLAGMLPDLEQTAKDGMGVLSQWAMGLAQRLPGGMGDFAQRNVQKFFSGGGEMLDGFFRQGMELAGGMLKTVPDGALVLGTGVISGYMISARLPKIREWAGKMVEKERMKPVFRTLVHMKDALVGYVKAQAKLMGITWGILALGFLLLRIGNGLLWATVVAVVDVLPVLGTGTVLLPWSLLCFLQGDGGRAVGLLGLYSVIALTRSLLEPKILGAQLGLDPLAALLALYGGYRLFGLGGMLLAPLVTVAAVQMVRLRPEKSD